MRAADASVEAPRAAAAAHGRTVPRVLPAAALALVLALQIAAFHDLRHDDAYITYRYAENVARGRGPVFNPGERVLGTSAPGHMLLAAAAYRLLGHERLPAAMAVVGCLAWAAQAAALYALLCPALGRVGAAGAAALVAAGASGAAEWVALETNLVAALVLWGMVAARSERWDSAAVAAGAATLVRPDAAVAAAVVGAFVALRTRSVRRSLRFALLAGAVVLPWALFAGLYYGSAVPQTAHAKIGVTPWAPWLEHLLLHPGARPLQDDDATTAAIGWGLALGGAVTLARRERALLLLPAWGLAHLLAYVPLRSIVYHTWHLYPATLAATALAGAALAALASSRRRAAALVGVAALVVFVGASAWRTTVYARAHGDGYWNGGRDRAYRAAAAFIARHARPGDVVASVEVGTLGYWGDLWMFDLGALITPLEQAPGWYQRVQWLVTESIHSRKYAHDRRPAATFRAGEFTAYVHMGAAPAPPASAPPAAASGTGKPG